MTISVAESMIMECLWANQPLSAEEIHFQIGDRQQWSIGTVKSLLNRLLRKKAVAAKRSGRKYLYRPLLQREEYINRESCNLIDRLFEGQLSAFVLHFSERQQLSESDIIELKRLIAELDDER